MIRPRGWRTGLSTLLAVVWIASPAGAQEPTGQVDGMRQWAFPVGERMEYSVNWGRVRLGEGALTVEAIDTVGSREAYRVALEMKRDTRYEFDVEGSTYDRWDVRDGEWKPREEETDVAIPDGALDDLSFLFFARLLPLEVGQRYELDLYFKESGNPVIIEVLRREEIRVPAGTFQTIVLRPIIRTGGVFGDGGEAELYLSDDEQRAIVRLKTSMKVGSGNMFLTSYEPGDGALIPLPEAHAAEAVTEGSR